MGGCVLVILCVCVYACVCCCCCCFGAIFLLFLIFSCSLRKFSGQLSSVDNYPQICFSAT